MNPRTCGDCCHFKNPNVQGLGYCRVPLPEWVAELITKPEMQGALRFASEEEAAANCPCFQREISYEKR